MEAFYKIQKAKFKGVDPESLGKKCANAKVGTES